MYYKINIKSETGTKFTFKTSKIERLKMFFEAIDKKNHIEYWNVYEFTNREFTALNSEYGSSHPINASAVFYQLIGA